MIIDLIDEENWSQQQMDIKRIYYFWKESWLELKDELINLIFNLITNLMS